MKELNVIREDYERRAKREEQFNIFLYCIRVMMKLICIHVLFLPCLILMALTGYLIFVLDHFWKPVDILLYL